MAVSVGWQIGLSISLYGSNYALISSELCLNKTSPALCRTRGDVADGLLGMILSPNGSFLLHFPVSKCVSLAAINAGVAAFKMTAGDR